jgi:hypothetical protein
MVMLQIAQVWREKSDDCEQQRADDTLLFGREL